jgi:hypothetical protein
VAGPQTFFDILVNKHKDFFVLILQRIMAKPSLSIEDAQLLFNEIVNDSVTTSDVVDGEAVCLISHKPLGSNTVTLPCGHKFDYEALLLDHIAFKKANHSISNKRCPYCRQTYEETIPYRPDLLKTKARYINYPCDICFVQHECVHSEDGVSCSINATIPVGDKFACFRHYKSELKRMDSKRKPVLTVRKCEAILKSGKSKGESCGVIIKDSNSSFCKRHSKP